jgi:lysophospholipase L1-like esterase
MHSGRGSGRLWVNLALAAASVLFFLLAAESIARLAWRETVVPSRPIPPEWRDLPRFAPGPNFLANITRPNARGLVAGALFETNSSGFRGRERSFVKPPDVFRIVVIGDSWTMGWGVTLEETYAARLERALPSQLSDRAYEVLNMGVSGFNAYYALSRFEWLGFAFDPDLLIYGFTVNDIEGPDYRESRDMKVFEVDRFQRSPFRLWAILGPRWASLRDRFWPERGSYLYELDDNYFRNPKAWQLLAESIERMGVSLQKRSMCGVLLIHTHPHELGVFHPYHRYYDRVAKLAEHVGLFVVPSFAEFRGHRAQNLWVGPGDDHPNAAGHELLARALLHGLEGLPDKCWVRAEPGARPTFGW